MKVVLAEKPSVARDLAQELKATQKCDGYLEGNGWRVTWAYGHMVELKEPDEYDPALKRWSLEPLPFVPDKFALRPRGDESSQRQLHVVKRLFSQAEEIVCATDAGREGELIFRYLLHWCRCAQKPVKRLWISSLTPKAIREGFAQLRPSTDFDSLYRAAKCRSEADWIVGINATRFFTVRYGGRGVLWSTGRVQTPVLALIVERDFNIEQFKSEDYWEIYTQYRGVTFKNAKGKFNKQADAQAVLERVADHDLVVTDLKEKEERLPAPLLYDLTALQKDMNARFGMTADEVLQSAQRLYEKKYLTYPRTDSRYLSSEFKQTLPGLLLTLRKIYANKIEPLDLQNLKFTKRFIDDAKVTDHHAIIPTDVLPHSLGSDDQHVYSAVATRLIAVFYPPCIKRATTVQAEVNREPFKATGRVLIDPGWLTLYRNEESKKRQVPEHEQILPKFAPGERGSHKPEIKQLQTKPPRPFNESSLLQMMETAGKTVDDEALREAMKDKGIGTPATRASIIELLLERGYIQREKKNLLSTDRGRHLIGLIRDERLKSPELTGEWEYTLKRIEAGQGEPDQFMADVIAHAHRLVTEAKAQNAELGPCPLCNAAVIKGRRDYGCSQWKKGCTFVLPSRFHSAEISPPQAGELLRCGKSLRPVLLVLEGERRFATLRLNTDVLEYTLLEAMDSGEEARNTIGCCPLCSGSVLESAKVFGCVNWRNGCGFKVWKTIAKRKIPKTAVKKLLRDGMTDVITDFTSNAGNKFDAKLQIVNGDVRFVFDDRNT